MFFFCFSVKKETFNYKVTALYSDIPHSLTVGQYCCSSKRVPPAAAAHELRPRIFVLLSCQREGPPKESEKKGKLKLLKWKMLNEFEKVGKKRVKQNMNPQQKGDWKDLLLMSISFAVYVYISQMLVSAYFAWTMHKPMW